MGVLPFLCAVFFFFLLSCFFFVFFFNDTATTEIYTLSLHDALPIYVTTYSEIANSIGKPKAVRAVGTAVGRNPISLLIPCHRALRKSGELGGYHWGLPVKRAILAWESARADANFKEAV